MLVWSWVCLAWRWPFRPGWWQPLRAMALRQSPRRSALQPPPHQHKGLFGWRHCVICQRARAKAEYGVNVPPPPSLGPAPACRAGRRRYDHAMLAPGATCPACQGQVVMTGPSTIIDNHAPGYAVVGGPGRDGCPGYAVVGEARWSGRRSGPDRRRQEFTAALAPTLGWPRPALGRARVPMTRRSSPRICLRARSLCLVPSMTVALPLLPMPRVPEIGHSAVAIARIRSVKSMPRSPTTNPVARSTSSRPRWSTARTITDRRFSSERRRRRNDSGGQPRADQESRRAIPAGLRSNWTGPSACNEGPVFFCAPSGRFVRDRGRFGPMDKHKAYSRTEVATAPRPQRSTRHATRTCRQRSARLSGWSLCLNRRLALVCDGPGLIVSYRAQEGSGTSRSLA